MSEEPLSNLDRHIEELEQQLENARRLRQLLAESPKLADVLLPSPAVSSRMSPNGTSTGKPRRSRPARRGGPVATKNHEKIVVYLSATDGHGKTVNEIAEGTKLTRSAVVQILYRTHADDFEKADAPDSRLLKLWKLKKGVVKDG